MISTFEERGIEKGIEKGQVRLIIRLLAHKFGVDAAELLRAQIESLSATDLESFGEAVLDFNTPAEAEAWLSNAKKAK
jgi:PHP family Zn ribbon phosphoesterase